MSNYRNFIEDFPKRCGEILCDYKKKAFKNELEVTHMFAIASAAIAVPLARLRDIDHPSFDKKKKYPQAVSQFDNLCGQIFLSSRLWRINANSWKSGLVDKTEIHSRPYTWEGNVQCLENNIKVKKILSIIRNALHTAVYLPCPRIIIMTK